MESLSLVGQPRCLNTVLTLGQDTTQHSKYNKAFLKGPCLKL